MSLTPGRTRVWPTTCTHSAGARTSATTMTAVRSSTRRRGLGPFVWSSLGRCQAPTGKIAGRQTGARARFRRSRRRLLVGARLTWLRVSLKGLEVVAPAAADRRALELWCDLPSGSGLRRDFRPYPGDVVRLPVPRGGEVVAEVWGEGPVVYLMHGWGGWRGQLGAFVEPLAAIGHRVVAVDAPSHGDSDPGFMGRRRGTVMELMEALDAAGQQFGPAAGVIAHSLGCTVAAQVVRTSLPAERLVLIAPNHGFGEVVEQFSAPLRLNPRTRDHLRASLEAITRKPIEEFDLEPLGADGSMPDTLVLHDRAERLEVELLDRF